jgi:hypothetical protein
MWKVKASQSSSGPLTGDQKDFLSLRPNYSINRRYPLSIDIPAPKGVQMGQLNRV